MIEARELRKEYPGEVRALDGLSFQVAPGTVFGLLGPNGAGKSTAVKVLTTLARPDGGDARVAGLNALKEPAQVRSAIGVVAQKSGVDADLTGRENVKLQGDLQAAQAGTDWGTVAGYCGLLTAFALACTVLATRAFRAYQAQV
jgi:ABC-2 type transport system ATP-binding protein